MNRIFKRIIAKHGIDNRNKALLFIDGHIFGHANHPIMIRQYLSKHKNKLLRLIKDYYKQYSKFNPNISLYYQSNLKNDLAYAEENLTLPPDINNAMGEFAEDRFAPDNMSYAIGHITETNQGLNIYISINSIRNISMNELIEILKKRYPNCNIYNDDINSYPVLYISPRRTDKNNHKRKYNLQFVISLIYDIDINLNRLKNDINKQFIDFNNVNDITEYKISFDNNVTHIILTFKTIETELSNYKICTFYEEKIKQYIQNIHIPNVEVDTYIRVDPLD